MDINDYNIIMSDMKRYLDLYADQGYAPPPASGTVSHTTGDTVQIQIDPLKDLVVGGVIQAEVAGVKIVKKVDTPPQNWRDGELLADIPKDQLVDVGMSGTARSFVTHAAELEAGRKVYYGLFSYSKKGAHNETSTSVYEPKDSWKVGFLNNPKDNDETVTSWGSRYDNNSWGAMRPGAYGSWLNWNYFANAKPYMVGWDGKAYYQLDVNDYTKKADGSPSHINDEGFPGGAFVWLPRAFSKRSWLSSTIYAVEMSSQWPDATWSGSPFLDHTGQWMEGLWIPMFFPNSTGRSLPLDRPVTNETYSRQRWRVQDQGERVRMMNWHTWAFMRDLIHGVTGTVNTQKVFGTGANASSVNRIQKGWMTSSSSGTVANKFMHSVCFTNAAVGVRLSDFWLTVGGQFNRTMGTGHIMPGTIDEFRNLRQWMGTTQSKNFNVWSGLVHNGQEPTNEPFMPWTGQGSNDGWDKFVVGDWTNIQINLAVVGGHDQIKSDGSLGHIRFDIAWDQEDRAVSYLPVIEPPVGYSPVGM